MLDELDSDELTAWMAYERCNGPLGGSRISMEFAYLRTILVNMFCGKKDQLADHMLYKTPVVKKVFMANGAEQIVEYFKRLAKRQDKQG